MVHLITFAGKTVYVACTRSSRVEIIARKLLRDSINLLKIIYPHIYHTLYLYTDYIWIY